MTAKTTGVMQRFFIITGIALILIGLLWPYILKSGLGRLPGDLAIRRGHFTFYFPLATSLLLSLVFSGLLWLLRK